MSPQDNPRLRLHHPPRSLVWQFDAPRGPLPRRPADVMPEPAPAPTLRRSDPRWVLAVRTWQVMQGEVLTASARASLLKIGRAMGLRDFESSLILAIVQDQARRREPLAGARRMVAMVPHDERSPRRPRGFSKRSRHVAAWVMLAMVIEAAACWAVMRAW